MQGWDIMTVLLVDSDKQALDREARRLVGRQSGMMVVLHLSLIHI